MNEFQDSGLTWNHKWSMRPPLCLVVLTLLCRSLTHFHSYWCWIWKMEDIYIAITEQYLAMQNKGPFWLHSNLWWHPEVDISRTWRHWPTPHRAVSSASPRSAGRRHAGGSTPADCPRWSSSSHLRQGVWRTRLEGSNIIKMFSHRMQNRHQDPH